MIPANINDVIFKKMFNIIIDICSINISQVLENMLYRGTTCNENTVITILARA